MVGFGPPRLFKDGCMARMENMTTYIHVYCTCILLYIHIVVVYCINLNVNIYIYIHSIYIYMYTYTHNMYICFCWSLIFQSAFYYFFLNLDQTRDFKKFSRIQ